MENSIAHPVLRCQECNKPFDKESSLKRHGYYCRSRRGDIATRSRSCVACAKAKARCDNGQPECSRCLSKATRCAYPPNVLNRRRRSGVAVVGATTNQQDAVPLLAADPFIDGSIRELGVVTDASMNDILDIPYTNFDEFGMEPSDLDFNFTDLLIPPKSDKVEWFSLSDVTPRWISKIQLHSVDPSIPAIPSNAVRSFNQRPRLNPSAQRINRLILHTLKSYPLMMLRDNALPPFIHQQLLFPGVENRDMEPLTNCISLVQMLSGQTYGSRKLFWKNVRMECERLCVEHAQLQKWELLAATQALSIYLLMRLDEGETEHNNIDALLVTTIVTIATQFNSTDIGILSDEASSPTENGFGSSWEDWLLKESGRRMCIIYQIVNMLVYFEPAAMCKIQQTDLILAPLPAKKQLWEAASEAPWKVERNRQPEELDTIFGLAASGDLVRMDRFDQYCGNTPVLRPDVLVNRTRRTVEWEEWCSGMDEMGGLVMLAASLIS